MANQCSSCGAEVTEQDKFCHKCGHPVVMAVPEEPALPAESVKPSDEGLQKEPIAVEQPPVERGAPVTGPPAAEPSERPRRLRAPSLTWSRLRWLGLGLLAAALVVGAVVAGFLLLGGDGEEEGEEGEEGEKPPAATEEAEPEDELGLDEYFRRFEDISDAAERGWNMLGQELVGEDIDATRDFFDGIDTIGRESLNDLEDLHPPAEVRDAHDEYLVSFAAVLGLLEDLTDPLADLESQSELEALLWELQDDPELEAASERLDDACIELQDIADEKDIDVDLECD